jgi:hypothetical protein
MGLTALALAVHRTGGGLVREIRVGPGPGMMDDGPGGAARISPAAAQQIASDWLATNQPGAQLGTPFAMPRGYVFAVLRDGVRVGTLVVGDEGRVAYRQFAVPSPTPSPSATA